MLACWETWSFLTYFDYWLERKFYCGLQKGVLWVVAHITALLVHNLIKNLRCFLKFFSKSPALGSSGKG